jgi:hypothetical protein
MGWKAYRNSRVSDAAELFGIAFEYLLMVGGISAAAFAVFLGRLFLAGIFIALAFGIFLRFKRRRVRQKSQPET